MAALDLFLYDLYANHSCNYVLLDHTEEEKNILQCSHQQPGRNAIWKIIGWSRNGVGSTGGFTLYNRGMHLLFLSMHDC